MPTERINIDLIPAQDGDIDDMAELWAEAFPERPAERRARELREGMVYGNLSDCWIVRVDKRIAGALRTYRFTTHMWGHAYATMGLAGVATAPDFRRRGIGRHMCTAALEIARERGDVLSVLFPFRTSFYRDLGYALVGSLHRYRFHPDELTTYPGWDRVERAPDDGPALAREIYDSVAREANGLLVRNERMWNFLEAEGHYLYLHRDARGRPTGYIVVRARGGSPDKSTLVVRELVALDREAYLALLGWVSVQRDQWANIIYDAVPGEDFQRRLAHPRTQGSGAPRGLWFHSAHLLRGPMIRIVNLERVLADVAVQGADESDSGEGVRAGSGAGIGATLQVRDGQLPENQGIWRQGERIATALDPTSGPVLSINEVTGYFAAGDLPGQRPAVTAWQPNLGLRDYRLLDEF